MFELLQYLRKNPELVLVTGIFLGFQLSVGILTGIWIYLGGVA